MKIMKKITWYHNRIQEGDGALAERLRGQSIKALLGGKDSDDWKIFMRNFHSNPKQLKRLRGQDTDFMADSWGPTILAYIVGSGPCGGGTNFAMVMDMRPPIRRFLDAGIDPATQPGDVPADDPVPIPDEFKRFLEDESSDTREDDDTKSVTDEIEHFREDKSS